MTKTIQQNIIKKLFEYKDGQLLWKTRPANCIQIGDIAGSINKYGYKRVQIQKNNYAVHRVIWTLLNGEIKDDLQIDHINGKRDDNRIENLRLVTNQENQYNRDPKGHYWVEARKRWVSIIQSKGKQKTLGYFKNKIDARKSYLKAKSELHIVEVR
jgi:hypothetical protein